MAVAALALLGAASWGTGDFLGGVASRRIHVLTVLVLSQAIGLCGAVLWLLASGDGVPGVGDLLPAAGAGACGAIGLAALYRGMAVGAMGIVAPISAASPIVPLAVDLGRGVSPSAAQWAGIVAVLGGIVLLAREPGTGRRTPLAAGVALALVAALAFGLFIVGLDAAADGSVPWTIVTARGSCSASGSTGRAGSEACSPSAAPPSSLRADLDVEADVEHVAVGDDVGLSLEALRPALRRLGVRAGVEEIPGRDHLAADEPARDVRVDRRCRVERGLAVAERPRARLLLARGEERNQAERVLQPPHDLVERRRPVAELGGLLVRELGELRLQLAVDAARPVLDRKQRLRRQRIELRRQLARPVCERVAGIEVREESGQRLGLAAFPCVARLRLLLHPLVATLDVVAVGDEQLELQCLEIVVRRRAVGEAVEHREDGVDLTEVAEKLRSRARNVHDADRCRRHLLRLDELGEPAEALVGDRRHADVGLVRHRRVRGDLRPGAGQRVEQRRLAAVRKPYDPHLERHRRPG